MGRIILYSVVALIVLLLVIQPTNRFIQDQSVELNGAILAIHKKENPLLETRFFVFPKRMEVVTLIKEEQVVQEEIEEVLAETKMEKEVDTSTMDDSDEKEESVQKPEGEKDAVVNEEKKVVVKEVIQEKKKWRKRKTRENE